MWQVVQDRVVGKWFAGKTVEIAPVKVAVDEWQTEQSKVVGV
jgi:hypothetical protein